MRLVQKTQGVNTVNQLSMTKPDLRLVALCAGLMLTGCVSVPHKPFDKAANTHVRKIALMPINIPQELTVTIVNHPGNNFGLIGALVAAGDTAGMTQTFTQQQKTLELKLESEITKALSEMLTVNGSFEFIPPGSSQRMRTEFLMKYPEVQCDAYLDVVIQHAGYSAQGPTTPYVPSISVPVRLVDAKTKQVLYTATIFMTDGKVPEGGEQILPNREYYFSDFDDLKGEPQRANEGLKKAAQKAAIQIVTDLTGDLFPDKGRVAKAK
jgi:hypothetical protein